MTQLRRSWYRSAREKHLRTQPIGLQPTPLRHLVVQAPGAPESNRCNRQHHPGQLPVTDFLDHLHHCVTPSWLASHACDTSLLASHMPLGLSENPAILRVVGHKNERIRTKRTVRIARKRVRQLGGRASRTEGVRTINPAD